MKKVFFEPGKVFLTPFFLPHPQKKRETLLITLKFIKVEKPPRPEKEVKSSSGCCLNKQHKSFLNNHSKIVNKYFFGIQLTLA